jgi:ribosomal protein L24E
MGATKLNQPVQSLVPTRTGQGYWLVASDGGIFAFGDAAFKGSMGATKLNKPVVGMVRYGDGYLMVAADGGIFDFSSKPFVGSLGDNPPAKPIVFAATLDS